MYPEPHCWRAIRIPPANWANTHMRTHASCERHARLRRIRRMHAAARIRAAWRRWSGRPPCTVYYIMCNVLQCILWFAYRESSCSIRLVSTLPDRATRLQPHKHETNINTPPPASITLSLKVPRLQPVSLATALCSRILLCFYTMCCKCCAECLSVSCVCLLVLYTVCTFWGAVYARMPEWKSTLA